MSNLKKELKLETQNENFDVTESGLYFPKQGVLVKGEYFDRINDGEWQKTENLVTNQGMALILNIALGAASKKSNFYLALFTGSATPAAGWNASNFNSNATELTSNSEGYTSVTRPEWVPSAATTNQIDNLNSVAELTMATASSLTVRGAALLTNATKGGTTGELISATKYDIERTFQNGDIYQLGYRLSFTV